MSREAFYRMLEDDEAEDGSIIFGESFMGVERQQMNLDPECGRRYVYDLIHGHDQSCYHTIRMYPPVYIQLCEKLKEDYHLKETDNVSIHESVAIFLNICAHNLNQRYVGKIFGHSKETIERKFHEVLSNLRDDDFDSNNRQASQASNVVEENYNSDEDEEDNNPPTQYMEGIQDQISASLWDDR
ncbi:unnamed protein product [Thlaspi arvense]|uniref:DUF8040 domain-containing protein n=1 Tax=Thlaspi arvense TaxID=13288 RepID=A0AAU9RTP6_THLAR|nr:unnamed protein product [Thlaspi arvense]